MPSLLDIYGKASDVLFGEVPQIYTGLLSADELNAAKARARSNALAQMANAFYAAAAPKDVRTSTGQAITSALQAGQGGFESAIKSQLQEKLTQQKLQQTLESQKRAKEAQDKIKAAFRPAQAGQAAQPAPYLAGAPYGKATPEIPATPARFDLQAIAPELMLYPEGRAALNELLGAQKAMRPEMFSLAEGATQFERDPMTGEVRQVGAGAQKIPEQQRLYEFAKTPAGGNFKGTFEQFKALSAPKTTINMGGEKALADTVGKDIGSMLGPATEQARVAMETITNAGNIESALDKAITGPAADARTTLLRVGQSLGIAGKDANEILANTQILVQGLAKAELQAAEAMKGQGQITENERAIIKKASAGTQNMTPAEIKASLIAIRKVAENKIKRQQTLLQQFRKLPNVEQYAPFYELPAYTPTMGGSTQNSLQQMLDEEAKKRGL
jgi:hypothetical protein